MFLVLKFQGIVVLYLQFYDKNKLLRRGCGLNYNLCSMFIFQSVTTSYNFSNAISLYRSRRILSLACFANSKDAAQNIFHGSLLYPFLYLIQGLFNQHPDWILLLQKFCCDFASIFRKVS